MSIAYRNLITSFAQLTELASLCDTVHEGCVLVVNGVHFTMHGGASLIGEDWDRIDIFADFGEVPADREAAVMRRLLEVNLLLSSSGTARLGLDADTGHVVLAWQHRLNDMDADVGAQRLLESIGLATQQALQWRHGYYLDEPGFHGDLRHAVAV